MGQEAVNFSWQLFSSTFPVLFPPEYLVWSQESWNKRSGKCLHHLRKLVILYRLIVIEITHQNCNQYLCILLGLDFSAGLFAIIAAIFPQLAFASGLGSILFASPVVIALMLEVLLDPRTEDGC